MRKIAKIIGTSLLILVLVWVGTVVADRQRLSDNLVRLHVVAASDSQADQTVKMKVRDAVIDALQETVTQLPDVDSAKAYLNEQLPHLQAVAQTVLTEAGMDDSVSVELGQESFPTRHYDTFSLPAGVYESLKITIGEGEGKNWWCVVFPSLCLPATAEGFTDAAAGAGFPESLSGALQHDGSYEIRFFFLDCFGWLENLFHKM